LRRSCGAGFHRRGILSNLKSASKEYPTNHKDPIKFVRAYTGDIKASLKEAVAQLEKIRTPDASTLRTVRSTLGEGKECLDDLNEITDSMLDYIEKLKFIDLDEDIAPSLEDSINRNFSATIQDFLQKVIGESGDDNPDEGMIKARDSAQVLENATQDLPPSKRNIEPRDAAHDMHLFPNDKARLQREGLIAAEALADYINQVTNDELEKLRKKNQDAEYSALVKEREKIVVELANMSSKVKSKVLQAGPAAGNIEKLNYCIIKDEKLSVKEERKLGLVDTFLERQNQILKESMEKDSKALDPEVELEERLQAFWAEETKDAVPKEKSKTSTSGERIAIAR
jgi:hypothetical protein